MDAPSSPNLDERQRPAKRIHQACQACRYDSSKGFEGRIDTDQFTPSDARRQDVQGKNQLAVRAVD